MNKPSQLMFYEVERFINYFSKLMPSDLRPIVCEQVQSKKLIFASTVTKQVTLDINYNSKITFCLWDEC